MGGFFRRAFGAAELTPGEKAGSTRINGYKFSKDLSGSPESLLLDSPRKIIDQELIDLAQTLDGSETPDCIS